MNAATVTANIERAPRKSFYHVAPRYSGGSPAMVSQDIALSVAVDEIEFHEHAAEGVFGADKQQLAKTKGLAGVVYARWEKGRKVFRLDLITGEEFEEPKRLDWEEHREWCQLWVGKERNWLTPAQEQRFATLNRRAEIHREQRASA